MNRCRKNDETNLRGAEAIAGVLIGGQSRRMQTCKALLPFVGATFIEHVVQAAQAVVDEIVLLGHATWDVPSLGGLTRLSDEPGFAGPLAGLIPLLEYASDRWALLVACDMPLLKSQALKRLLEACDESVDGAVFRVADDESFFPCCAVFHAHTVSEARFELARSASLQGFIGRLRCRILDVDAAEARGLRSFNTREEYADLIGIEHKLDAEGISAQ